MSKFPKPKTQNLAPKTYNLKPSQRGTAVLFAVLLTTLFLSIVITLSAIFIPKLKTAGDLKRSVAAVYAAESGIEWCLYINRIGSVPQPILSNGATFINSITNLPFVETDCSTFPIKSVGTFQGVTRIFEASMP